jgi:hypothetical protein
MAPAHSTHPRVQQQQQQRDQSANPDIAEHGLFLEPMMGTPLAMYVHKDVPDHDRVLDLITVSGRPIQSRARLHNLLLAKPRQNARNCNCCLGFLLYPYFLCVLAPVHYLVFLTISVARKMEARSPTRTAGSIIS